MMVTHDAVAASFCSTRIVFKRWPKFIRSFKRERIQQRFFPTNIKYAKCAQVVMAMTLSQLVIRSMKKNIKHYYLYFFALIFSVTLYFSFITLQHNPTRCYKRQKKVERQRQVLMRRRIYYILSFYSLCYMRIIYL